MVARGSDVEWPESKSYSALQVSVTHIVEQSIDVRVVGLKATSEYVGQLTYCPGSAMRVLGQANGEKRTVERFFLSSSPDCDSELQIVVDRTFNSPISENFFDGAVIGTVLDVLPPERCVNSPGPHEDLLMCAQGSGIAPVISLIKSVLAAGSGRVVLFYVNTSVGSVLFGRELQFLAEDHPDRLTVFHFLEELQGKLDSAQYAAMARHFRVRTAFVCGPKSFTDTVEPVLSEIGSHVTTIDSNRWSRSVGGNQLKLVIGND